MSKPRNESIHDRLNREMYRDIYGGWKQWSVILALLALFLWVIVPQPQTTEFRQGTVTGVTTLLSESGTDLRIGVQLDDIRIEASTRAHFSAPANGEIVCVAHSLRTWTGLERFQIAPMRQCGDAGAQPDD